MMVDTKCDTLRQIMTDAIHNRVDSERNPDDFLPFTLPGVVKICAELVAVSIFNSLGAMSFSSQLTLSARNTLNCNRHPRELSSDLKKCLCIRMAEGVVKGVEAENEDDDRDNDAIPWQPPLISHKPRPPSDIFPANVGHEALKEIRKKFRRPDIRDITANSECTCVSDDDLFSRGIVTPLKCQCTVVCPRCSSGWNADNIEIGRGIIFDATDAYHNITVYGKRCSNSSCEEVLLPDALEYGLVTFGPIKSRRRDASRTEERFIFFDLTYLHTITGSLHSSSYSEIYEHFLTSISEEEGSADIIVNDFIPSKPLFIKMVQIFITELVRVPIELLPCKNCGKNPEAVGCDGMACGLRWSLNFDAMLAMQRLEKEKLMGWKWAKLSITHPELVLFTGRLGACLVKLLLNNTAPKGARPKPFTRNDLEDALHARLHNAGRFDSERDYAGQCILEKVAELARDVERFPQRVPIDEVAMADNDISDELRTDALRNYCADSVIRAIGEGGPSVAFSHLCLGAGLDPTRLIVPDFISRLPAAISIEQGYATRVVKGLPHPPPVTPADDAFAEAVKESLRNYFKVWRFDIIPERPVSAMTSQQRAMFQVRESIMKLRAYVMLHLNDPVVKSAFTEHGAIKYSERNSASFYLDSVCPPIMTYLRRGRCRSGAHYHVAEEFILPLLAQVGRMGVDLWLRPEIYVRITENGYITEAYEDDIRNQKTLTAIAKEVESMLDRNDDYAKECRSTLAAMAEQHVRVPVSQESDRAAGFVVQPQLLLSLKSRPPSSMNLRPPKKAPRRGGPAAGGGVSAVKFCCEDDDYGLGDTCEKEFPESQTWTWGLFILTCMCSKPCIYAIKIMHRGESPKNLEDIIMERFDVPPKYVFYDFGCKAFKYCFRRNPLYWWTTTFIIDRLHQLNHYACAVVYRMSPHYDKREELKNVRTQAMETVNKIVRKYVEKSLTWMSFRNALDFLYMFMCNRNAMANK